MMYTKRTFCCNRRWHMMDYVERAHLQGVSADQTISCRHPICKYSGLILNNLMHFKNHVQTVRGISFRAWWILLLSYYNLLFRSKFALLASIKAFLACYISGHHAVSSASLWSTLPKQLIS
jgi:hypothetical protein